MNGAKKAIEALSSFCFHTLGLKANLSDLGILEEHFKAMASHACTGGAISGPKDLMPADVEQIYKMCLWKKNIVKLQFSPETEASFEIIF